MLVLSTRIRVLDLFYLLIFYSEKFSTDVCRLPYAVNVNLNLSNSFLQKTNYAVGFLLKAIGSFSNNDGHGYEKLHFKSKFALLQT